MAENHRHSTEETEDGNQFQAGFCLAPLIHEPAQRRAEEKVCGECVGHERFLHGRQTHQYGGPGSVCRWSCFSAHKKPKTWKGRSGSFSPCLAWVPWWKDIRLIATTCCVVPQCFWETTVSSGSTQHLSTRMRMLGASLTAWSLEPLVIERWSPGFRIV